MWTVSGSKVASITVPAFPNTVHCYQIVFKVVIFWSSCCMDSNVCRNFDKHVRNFAQL